MKKGPKDAKIVLVEGYISDADVREGKYFGGSGGKKLEECLHSAKLSRTTLYLTAVLNEKVPVISRVISLDGRKHTETAEFYGYVESLRQELKDMDYNVIVAVGPIAMYALTGKKQIMKWHGSILESTILPGKKVIPIIKPSSALREYLLTYMIIHDLKRVALESEYPELNLPTYDMVLNPGFEQAVELLDGLIEKKEPVAFDIEVVGQEVECFAFASSPKEAFCIALYDKGEVYTVEQEALLLQKTGIILEDPDIEVILQNGAFDCTFMRTKYGFKTTRIQDSMVAQALVAPDMPKGLGFLCTAYTRQPYYKDDGKMHYKGQTDDAKGFWRYNALDALITFEAYEILLKDVKSLGVEEIYNTTVGIIPILVEMQDLGIKMDTEGLKKEGVRLTAFIEDTQKELNKLAGMDLNVNSFKQLQAYFYVIKGVKPYTKKGRPTVDEKALIKLSAKGFAEASIILAIRKAKKYLSTYVSMNIDSDERLRCSFNPVGTPTGRLSSSKSIITKTGGNMQNLPHTFYKYMLVEEEYVAYSSDLSGAENRIVANVGPVPAMKQAFDEGGDVHRLTASLIFDIPIDDPKLLELCPLGGGLQNYRYWGKKMNHSSNYGIGKNALALALEIEPAAASKLLVAYHAQYPEVQAGFQAQVISMLRDGRLVTNLMGRKRLFLNRWGTDLFMSAFGHLPQSTVADMINRWGFYTLNNFKEVRIINQIHDSLVFEIPVSAGWHYHQTVLEALTNALEQKVTWRMKSFTIPLETKMMVGNHGNAEVVTDFSDLATTYTKLYSR